MKLIQSVNTLLIAVCVTTALAGCNVSVGFDHHSRGGMSMLLSDDHLASSAKCQTKVPSHYAIHYAKYGKNTVRVVSALGVACLEADDETLLRTFTDQRKSSNIYRFTTGKRYWIFDDNHFEKIPEGEDPWKWRPS